jgi:hypothetical protein
MVGTLSMGSDVLVGGRGVGWSPQSEIGSSGAVSVPIGNLRDKVSQGLGRVPEPGVWYLRTCCTSCLRLLCGMVRRADCFRLAR